MKIKYIRTKDNKIIVFGEVFQHSDFEKHEPVSAGFISFGTNKIGNPSCKCYGESISLTLKSNQEEDTILAMNQIMGYDYFFIDDNLI